ncbi:unnamed protein product [Urochloa decumbens]|uniref:F-box domain-containing protein n=1 Tax=Urochloa decumbens TaxID=240449 RepID=A0ABC9HD38_9POAL
MSIPTALFKSRRGREATASARYAVRRAGGAVTSLMARRSSGKMGPGRFLPKRRPLAAGSSLMARTSGRSGAGQILLRLRRDEDRLSALPDDLLLLILRRLDTRSAFGTGLLSKRWVHLAREVAALDVRVGDMLPPRYHRCVLLYSDARGKGNVRHGLLPNIWRYERCAMRAFTSSTESLLEGPRRMVSRLRLEFIVTANAGGINQLIAEAIDAWGVEYLEAVAKPTFNRRDGIHKFPSHGLCKEPCASHLRSLKLGGCVLPPLHEYSTLSMLVLKDIPELTPVAAYEGIFTLCLKLQTLHLISCGCSSGDGISLTLVADAPGSEIRELVVENCTFRRLWLKALPCLERLASGSRVLFESSSFPCLKQRNLTIRQGIEVEGLGQRPKVELDTYLQWTPDITDLIIRFTGPYRWIVPSRSPSAFLPNLRRLLVADVPSSWDVTWPRLLLEIAPSLESLHIHIAHCKLGLGAEINWPPTKLQHHHLNEFVVAGFKGTARQIYLVKFVVRACKALCHVAMFKNGYAQSKGHWDWEMVAQQHLWTDEEKENMLKQIMDRVPSSTAPVQLVLG